MNEIRISGICTEDLFCDYSVHGKNFFKTFLMIPRLSGTEDMIPVIVPESMILETEVGGRCVSISGEIRTWNKHEEEKNHLCVYVMAKDFIQKDEEVEVCENECIIDGFICKPPKVRDTPLGRTVSDFLLAVNRPYGRSDYIPCIAWGRNAVWCGDLEVGTHVRLKGRFQSREYRKEVSPGEFETRTAYEVSVSVIERVKENET